MNSQSCIELRDVAIQHADSGAVILDSVTWQIGSGEFWLVQGDQGSGKTDLIRTAAGLQAASGGSVLIHQVDVGGASEAENMNLRRRVGFVFEHGGRLLNQLTVLGNIALPLLYHGTHTQDTALASARESLERVGLGSIGMLLPTRISLVLQQRVGYLRALTDACDILFIDHPVGARWWADELQRLTEARRAANRPLTVVVASSEPEPWVDLVDHTAVIENRSFRS